MTKIVLRLAVHNEKDKREAMKAVSSLAGVDSIILDMKDQKMTVTGDVDPIDIVRKLRKLCHTELVSIGPVKEPEKKVQISDPVQESKEIFKIPTNAGSAKTTYGDFLKLIRGNMGLTTLPEDVEWELFDEIFLMDNKLSELPENLNCPKAKTLLLQNNFKLRMIPHSFFNQMPALEELNLSRTRIKYLPESLFGLVNLRGLFLKHCDLLSTIPPKIGELKRLELLDLEGTWITGLPVEVKQLQNLTSLLLSFCEPMNFWRSEQPLMIISRGVISALSKLKKLYIDVIPEDPRWNAFVEDIVSEVCGLKLLHTLRFYFPRLELMNYFQWERAEMVSPPLTHFSFTVGDHTERIIYRLPCDVEFELEHYDKCLKYVNGEGVPLEIKKVLGHTSAFFLDRHKTVMKLSDFGIAQMAQLKYCVVGECEKLRSIIDGDQLAKASGDATVGLVSLEYLHLYYAKNLRSIWEGRPLYSSSFLSLKRLTLCMCPELTTIFTPGLLANLSSLEELKLDDCPKITRIISVNDSDNDIKHDLPSLRRISLQFLPELDDISLVLLLSPRIEWMSFYHCPKLKTLPVNKFLHDNLSKIQGELHWWQELKLENGGLDLWDDVFSPINKSH